MPGDPLKGSSHTIVMALEFHPNNAAVRQWIFNFGQEGASANHWLYNEHQGADSIQFGAWNGGNQIQSADISGASTLATTWDAETKVYSLYVNGILAASSTETVMPLNINTGQMLMGKLPTPYSGVESDFQGCVKGVDVYKKALTDAQVADASSRINGL